MMMNNVFDLIMSSQRRKETMKELVMKYLRGRYFEKCEEDNLSGDDTTDDKRGKAGKEKRVPSSLRKTLSYLDDWLIVRRRSLPNLIK